MSSFLEPAAGPMQRFKTGPWAVRMAHEITTDVSRSALSDCRRLAEEALEEIDKLDRAVHALDGLAVVDRVGQE